MIKFQLNSLLSWLSDPTPRLMKIDLSAVASNHMYSAIGTKIKFHHMFVQNRKTYRCNRVTFSFVQHYLLVFSFHTQTDFLGPTIKAIMLNDWWFKYIVFFMLSDFCIFRRFHLTIVTWSSPRASIWHNRVHYAILYTLVEFLAVR